MQDKRGFTLVELIAVIAILAVIVVLITPSITNIAKSSKVTIRDSKISTLISAAENYGNDLINTYQLCNNSNSNLGKNCTVKIDELIKKGYIESDDKKTNVIIDPDTNEPLNGNLLLCYNPKEVNVYATYVDDEKYQCTEFSLNSDNTMNLASSSGRGYIGGNNVQVNIITGGSFKSLSCKIENASDSKYVTSCSVQKNKMNIGITKTEGLAFPNDKDGVKYKEVPIKVTGVTSKNETLELTYYLNVYPTDLQLGSPKSACIKSETMETLNLVSMNTGDYDIVSSNENVLRGVNSNGKVNLYAQRNTGKVNITITEKNGNKKVELSRSVYKLDLDNFQSNLVIREIKTFKLYHGGAGRISIRATSTDKGKIEFSKDGVNFSDTIVLEENESDDITIQAVSNGSVKIIIQSECETLEADVNVSGIKIKNPDGSDYVLSEDNEDIKEIYIGGDDWHLDLEADGNVSYNCVVLNGNSSATCEIKHNSVYIHPGNTPSQEVIIKVGVNGEDNNYSIIKVKVTDTSIRLVDENNNNVDHVCVSKKGNNKNDRKVFVVGERMGELSVVNPEWYLSDPSINYEDREILPNKRSIPSENLDIELQNRGYNVGYNAGLAPITVEENFGNKTAKFDYYIYDLQLPSTEGIVNVGGQISFDVSAYATGDISVESSNTSVARVSVRNPSNFDYGVNRENKSIVTVTGVRAGEAVITVRGSKCGEVTYNIIVDNGAPECVFEEFDNQYLANGDTTRVTLTCTDESGFRNAPVIRPANFTVEDSSILEVTNVSSGTAVSKGYSYQVTIRGKSYGYSYITLNAGVVADKGGNANRASSSNSLLITEYDPVQVWEIGADWDIDVLAILYDNYDYKGIRDNTYTLKIYGTGAANMKDYSSSKQAPWYQSYRSRITDVEFNDEVSNVGNYAFNNMSNLKTVNLSPITEYIGDYAFNNTNLESIIIPLNVDSIGNYAFYGSGYNQNFMKSITFERDSFLTRIGNYAFYNHHATDINIPNQVESIGSFAFYQDNDESTLSSLTFATNSNLETIGDYAFYSHKLTELDIPASVSSIGEYSFYNGTQTLETLEFASGSSLRTIGNYAFQNSIISSIIFPSSLESIGNYAFNNVPLENLVFDENSRLRIIGSHAFANTKVSSIHLGSNVNTLGTLFVSSVNFTEFNVDPSNPYLSQVDGVLYDKSQTRLIRVPDKYGSVHNELIMPETVKTIENYAIGGITFKSAENTFKLVLANGIEELNESTNFRYSPINEFEIIEGVNFSTIDGVLFDKEGKTLLLIPTSYKETSYKVPDGTRTIGEYAGYGQLNIDNITIPESVTSIRDYAFYTDYGFTMMELNVLENTEIKYTAFNSSNVDKERNITVHYESLKTNLERNLSGYANIKIVYVPLKTEESESDENR